MVMRKIVEMIPNAITCLNLLCGCMAILFAISGYPIISFWAIALAAVFDFFDGFAARMLKAYSPIGKQLDSLADMVSFGVAPAMIAYVIGAEFWGFMIAVFSALRLAKFNIDERQTSEFIGLPTPANALFFGALGFILYEREPKWIFFITENQVVLVSLVVVFSFLLVSEIRMFSLKFKNFSIKDNVLVYSFLLVSLCLILIFEVAAVPLIILIYIFVSIVRHIILKIRNKNSIT